MIPDVAHAPSSTRLWRVRPAPGAMAWGVGLRGGTDGTTNEGDRTSWDASAPTTAGPTSGVNHRRTAIC